jgi:acyl-CoA thioester hydrolase
VSDASGEPVIVTVEVEVRYAETDAMGVVHHSRYAVWFELARTRLCAESGWHYADIEKLGYYLMVSRLEVGFRRPARYGDTVEVDCRIARLASRALGFAYRVRRGGEELVTGATDHVWVEVAQGRPCRMPEPLRKPFAHLAGRS